MVKVGCEARLDALNRLLDEAQSSGGSGGQAAFDRAEDVLIKILVEAAAWQEASPSSWLHAVAI